MSYPGWAQISSSNFVRSREYPMLDADTPSFMGRPVASTPQDLQGADVAIIGSPYVASWGDYGGVAKAEWIAGPQRVRQQSARYRGYVQDFDIDVFEHLRVVDFGDADIPPESITNPTVSNVMRAHRAVEEKVEQVLDAGAVPVILGQNSPCATYSLASPLAARCGGRMGMVSLDAHWDAGAIDRLTMDPRIAGSGNWKRKLYEELEGELSAEHLVDIGERGMLEQPENVRWFLDRGAHFVSGWQLRADGGLVAACRALEHAYTGVEDVYFHVDLDVLGGGGPGSGDAFGELVEPMGMTDHELIRIAYEVGRRGTAGVSFVCIPPASPGLHRVVTYAIMFMLAGRIEAQRATTGIGSNALHAMAEPPA
jgi:agmatinase